jgi:hypothetical protein
LRKFHLSNQFHGTASFLDLSLSFLAEISCAHNDRDLGYPAFTKDFGVTKGEEVKDGCGVGFLGGEVCFSCFGRD